MPTPSAGGKVMAPIRDVVRVKACSGAVTLQDAAFRIWCLGQSFQRGAIPIQAAQRCSEAPRTEYPPARELTWPPKEPLNWSVGPAASPARSCDAAKEQSCQSLLQGQVPWTTSNTRDPSTRHWAQQDLTTLCACTPNPPQTVQCFQTTLFNNGHASTQQSAISACKAH